MAKKNGLKEKEMIWSVKTLPKFSVKNGPIDFVLKM